MHPSGPSTASPTSFPKNRSRMLTLFPGGTDRQLWQRRFLIDGFYDFPHARVDVISTAAFILSWISAFDPSCARTHHHHSYMLGSAKEALLPIQHSESKARLCL
jgi:hypothetical protein